jgi:hypothetical protein
VRQLFARFIVVVSLTISIGGHWGLLQTIGWANMILDFSQDRSLISAMSKTFDSETSCEICRLVREGKKQESHQDFLKSNIKLDLFHQGSAIALMAPNVQKDTSPVVRGFTTLRAPPDLPPPRLVLS